MNMCFISGINVLVDRYYNTALTTGKYFINNTLIDRYNSWHKYVFHFFITPILFVDALYCIELEKIKASKAKLFYRQKVYYFTQIVIGYYLLHALLVALFLDCQLEELYDSIFHRKEIENVSKIPIYSKVLADLIMLCIFMSLFVGLIDLRGVIVKF
ncbi:hypothetical protein GINT2_000872 [Glugoides intestinalis]